MPPSSCGHHKSAIGRVFQCLNGSNGALIFQVCEQVLKDVVTYCEFIITDSPLGAVSHHAC